jgi:signal transduction histidine kinase
MNDNDLRELRAATVRLEGVVRTQRDVALAGLDVGRVMEVVTERAMELTGSEGAVVEMAEGDEMVYRAASGTLLPHLGLRLKAASSISGLCARTGEILRTDDCESDDRVDREACRRVGARSMLLVPLRHEGAPVGVLKVISGRPHAFGERDVHTLELMAGLVGAALGQASAFEAKQALLVELDRSNRELREFAYVASHDLQEPLRKIQAFGDRLRARFGDALGEQGNDYIARMQGAAARMQALIQDLLSYSRASSKEMSVRPVDLDALARDVVSDLSERIRATGGTVELEPLPTFEADPTQMRQLLQNLVGNALKFHRDGVPPVVKVRGDSGPEWTRIVVQDNGVGFDEQYADRIFTPFQRLHGRMAYEGTGMGLAICRKIAERHGGRITVRSAPGVGSTFAVLLPTVPATPAEP